MSRVSSVRGSLTSSKKVIKTGICMGIWFFTTLK
jgi:hypothetical protein